MNDVPFVPEDIFPALRARPVHPDAAALARNAAASLPPSFAQCEARLARQLSTLLDLHATSDVLMRVIETFIASNSELFARVHSDFPNDSLTEVRDGLSDRHDLGRTVASITLASGRRFIYKPRDLAIDAWFSSLIRKLNLPLRSLEVIERAHYGYVEYAAPHPATHLDTYYRNAGSLICVLSLLQARDVHFQNLVCCGDQPVLVDCETLLQPSMRATAEISALRTGMLPRFNPADEHAYDVSALGGVIPQATHFQLPTTSATLEPSINVPQMNARPAPSEICEGFSATYELLSSKRDLLTRSIAEAANIPIRLLLRDTMDYHVALGNFVSGSSISNALPIPTRLAPVLYPEELTQLANLDIPRFNLPAGSRSLSSATNLFPLSGCDYAVAGLNTLSAEHLSEQLDAIRSSFAIYSMWRAFR